MDWEILKFTLSLYNNPLLSRKAVNYVIKYFNNFINDLFISFLQNDLKKFLKPEVNDEHFARTEFVLERSINIFQKYLTH